VIHTVKGFHVVNEAEVDVFLEFLCFLYDPMDVGNLISGSSDFSKPSIHKTKIMTSGLITSWQIEEKKEKATEKRKVTDFLFFFFFFRFSF